MEEQRWCSHGQHFAKASKFYKRGNGYQPNCRDCQNALTRQWYNKNKKKHIAHVLKNSRDRYKKFQEWKGTLRCQVCEEAYSKCLDFHHLDPTQKDISVGMAFSRLGKKRLRAEVEKCVVLCKNCHTKVHGGAIRLSDDIQQCTTAFGYET